jgi:hypothetical protein
VKIDFDLVSNWMYEIRENPRLLDCFWPSQVMSKRWILDNLAKEAYWRGNMGDIVIFGGWYGILAQMLDQKYPGKYISVDTDSSCEQVFNKINTKNRIVFKKSCMSEYDYSDSIFLDMVINTSSEHVSQEVYAQWWGNIPKGTKYIVQGNNFFETDEHVRCTDTLEEFILINYLESAYLKETLECGMRPDGSPFYRFMAIGVK